MEKAVREILTEVLPAGRRLGLAVSGGADSTALLHLAAATARATGIEPIVLHFDHGLRPNSDEDRRFVETMATACGLPFHHDKAAAAPASGSLEDWARRERYDFFRRAAIALGLAAVATGHTADDQAETVLFRLLVRGAGARGLAGIPAIRDAGEFLIIRPLLTHRRAEILAYLEHRDLPFRDDPMNRSLLFARNKIRHQVIPFLLEHCNPRLVESLGRTAEILRTESDYLEGVAGREAAAWRERDGAAERSRDELAALPAAIRNRVIHRIVERRGLYPSFDLVESIVGLTAEGDRIDLTPGLAAWIENGLLRIGATREPAAGVTGEFTVSNPGATEIPTLATTIEITPLAKTPRLAELRGGRAKARRLTDGFDETIHLAAAAVEGRLHVRGWRRGDRMTPFGLDGSRKLQDIFTDEKISRAERDRWPLLWDDRGILWLIGIRQDERTRVEEGSGTVLRIRAVIGRRSGDDPEAVA